MAYASASQVANYTPMLTDEGRFTPTTRPPLSAIEHWLSAGCALIEATLASAGFRVPVEASDPIYDAVVDLNALYAAAQAEYSRLTVRVTDDANTRAAIFQRRFRDGLQQIAALRPGDAATVSTARKGYIGGVWKSDKEDVSDDSDRIPTRFSRGQFRRSPFAPPAAATTGEED